MKPITLDSAVAFAVKKHAGQKDKGGNSYIRHVLRVMEQMDSEDEMIVAVLHDVLEDTDATITDLGLLGCSAAQINAILALTKLEGEPQTTDQYLAEIKKSYVARKVKIADIKDNMQLWRMKNKHDLGEKDFERIKKYLYMLGQLGAI